MKKNIKHISNLIIVAVVIFGLAVALPMSAMSAWFSATAQTAKAEDAIPSLKEQKLDDSLQDAVADTLYEARWEDRPARGMLAPAYHASNPAQQYDSYFTPNGLTLTPQDAPNDDINSNANQGAAYVFVRSNGVWTEQQKITDSGGAAQDRFGTAVDISVDTIVVGADPFPRQGAAYVFVRSSGFWSPQQKLTNDTGTGYDSFGVRVAVDLNTVVVGAPQDLIGANSQQGSAYVFVRNGTVWSKQAKLVAGDGAAGDQFGVSVAVSGNWVVAGAHFDSVGTTSLQGSAYVFVRTFSSWSQQGKLTASDGMANDYFGWSVAIHGSIIVVGAHYDDEGSYAQQGSAYVFVRSGQIWSQHQKLIAFDGRTSDRFGASVATSAGAIVVGSPSNDYLYYSSACPILWCVAPNQGSAFVFRQ